MELWKRLLVLNIQNEFNNRVEAYHDCRSHHHHCRCHYYHDRYVISTNIVFITTIDITELAVFESSYAYAFESRLSRSSVHSVVPPGQTITSDNCSFSNLSLSVSGRDISCPGNAFRLFVKMFCARKT